MESSQRYCRGAVCLTGYFSKKEPLPTHEHIADVVTHSDFVLIGMSNPKENAAIEIEAAEVSAIHGVPFGFYSDTFGACGREWFLSFSKSARLIFLSVGGDEIHGARQRFPNARVVCSGNPLWEDYFLPADRNKSRALVGVKSNEFVTLSPGGKDAPLNCQMWAAVIEAACHVKYRMRRPEMVVLTPHPGDKTPLDTYSSLVILGNAIGVRVLMETRAASDELVPGADAVVHSQNSSVGLHAMCRRIPVIDFYGPLAQERLRRGSGSFSGQYWGTGAVADVYSASYHGVADALMKIMWSGAMGDAQAKYLPTLAKGESVQKMKAAIVELITVRETA